jgi:hypothetical protein
MNQWAVSFTDEAKKDYNAKAQSLQAVTRFFKTYDPL